jgi:hypothetical protein
VSESQWLTVRAAAAALGITESAVRKRATKGSLDSRAGNDGRLRVLVAEFPQPSPQPLPETSAPGDGLVVELRAEVAELRRQVGELLVRAVAAETERDGERRRVADLQTEIQWLRAELERRRWPGLWPALLRFWRGEV